MGRDWGDDVLEEMLSLILSNLFGKDRHSFSLVCKRWNKAVSPFTKFSLLNYERSNSAWKLLLVFEYNNKWVLTDDTKIGVLRWGENVWLERVYQEESPFILSLCTPVLHQQLLHFLDLDENIGTFDTGSPRRQLDGTGKILQHFLIELRDKHGQGLLCVLVTHEKVNVFRMLFSEWAPVEDLEDKVLFLSRKACFAATAPCQSTANRIYFAKTCGDDDDDVVFYCLGTGRYRSCKGDFSSKEPYCLPNLNFATWIVATPTPVSPRDLTWCTSCTIKAS